MVVYYFSGTGNSLYIAKQIAEKTGGSAKPIGALMDKDVISTEEEAVGIVFPVYYSELPVMVKKFVRKLVAANAKYVFAVGNFGGAAARSFLMLEDELKQRGIALSAGFGVHMPQNSFKKPWEKVDKVYAQAEKRLAFIERKIEKRANGMFYTNVVLESIMRRLHPMMQKACRADFLKKTGASPELETDELIYHMDLNYSADENCNGCGICAKVCPAENIRMTDVRPEWLHHCENCLACYNWCPQKAVRGAIAKEGHYYRHRDVKVKDLMR